MQLVSGLGMLLSKFTMRSYISECTNQQFRSVGPSICRIKIKLLGKIFPNVALTSPPTKPFPAQVCPHSIPTNLRLCLTSAPSCSGFPGPSCWFSSSLLAVSFKFSTCISRNHLPYEACPGFLRSSHCSSRV